MLKEAMSYLRELAVQADQTEVLEINGKTYANKVLSRYDSPEYASPVKAYTLDALLEYIEKCSGEFRDEMIVHIVNPVHVRLVSRLDAERNRETLFEAVAQVSEFRFDSWYDQEMFMVALQANFQGTDDLKTLMKMAGNVEQKNSAAFSDDGVTQIATMKVGIASKADVIVPNPVTLIPFRTFQEVAQPASEFVFRMGDGEKPVFKLIEAQGGIWKNEAVGNIKEYLTDRIGAMDEDVRAMVTVIG